MTDIRESTAIPYDEIDCEIRRLVRLINAFPGIHTTGSCAGHQQQQPQLQTETEIDFVAESQATAIALLSAIPQWGYSAGFANNQAIWRVVWASVAPADGALIYKLRIGGSAAYIQRQLLAEVEDALAGAVR